MGGKSDPPPAPNYSGLAREQADISQQLALQQNYANRPGVTTPWGSMQWSTSAGVDPATGQPITNWQQTVGLTPDLQAATDAQQSLQRTQSELASDLSGRLSDAYADPFSLSGVDPYGRLTTDPASARQQAYENALSLDQPYQQERRSALEAQLANRGITPGSEAYAREMRRLGDTEARERLGFQQFANQAATQELGRDIAAAEYANALRGYQTKDLLLERGQPLNELNALVSGQQVGMPQMPGFSSAVSGQAPNLLAAANMGYQGALDAFSVDQAQQGALMKGLFGLGGAALGNPYLAMRAFG